ncbi:hypothetical protein GGS23DRAFT_605242 [Durotheca rogersii]|uniref:uncharacterized protein n=1 Tax=Durotheca rogersii TaxID=419775 RepID=UPI00221E878B|nr:uncharacterized protein GGS23DRAFT_605242 [Durotheca rogersii]KAI5863203.1 hypothetical protein GGS23DRAFT_605242 [Durotheca rogersii]
MTRPQMIRADSIDLQGDDALSAKDRKLASSKAAPNGLLAPHQAETLREVEEERAEEEARSPRVSWIDGNNGSDLQQYAAELANGIANSLNGNKMPSEDALAIAQNGGVINAAPDDGDMDGDTNDDIDDDMDKISSSPSIEDGGCTLPRVWPKRVGSLHPFSLPRNPTRFLVLGRPRSPSPYLEPTEYLPLQPSDRQASKASAGSPRSRRLLPGEYAGSVNYENYGSHRGHTECEDEPRVRTYEAQSRLEDALLHVLSGTRLVGPSLDEGGIRPLYNSATPLRAVERGGEEDEEDPNDNDIGGISLYPCTRPVGVGWGYECLQNLEDIDFEFVYALHTFVATVEGQANASKGDTMVLLDDSNSYWWLVRVVKDSSIGYLPAEHIETPTERLARLNKHRNIDLSMTMLGDQAEKAKTPLITAIKRRKMKTVAFAAPTYVDYSDYSSDEEDEDGDGDGDSELDGDKSSQQQGAQQKAQQQQTSSQQVDAVEDESAKVEPLRPRSQQKQTKAESVKAEDGGKAESTAQGEPRRNSDELFDGKAERTTRNGTVRNTDSFFKDETIETKKITLTPGLLRDDNEPRMSSDSKEFQLRQRPSLEKELSPDKNKDDKKKKDKDKKDKEKKPSAIRSFFSRKDRKKSVEEEDESSSKRSLDSNTDMPEKDAEEPHAADADASPERAVGPQRNPSKLQKHQPARGDPSPTRKSASSALQTEGSERGPILGPEVRTNNVANVPPATLRMVESDQLASKDRTPPKDEKANPKPVVSREGRPQKVTKAKSRVELDDFDSPDEGEIGPVAAGKPQPSEEREPRYNPPGAQPDSYASAQTPASEPADQAAKAQRPEEERLSESPVQVSPITSSNPPALVGDTSSQDDRSSPVSSPSPELVGANGRTHGKQDSLATSTSTATTSTWNDTSLRAFFDSGSDIRDLLVIVYDKSDVPPAGPDHPVAGSLFREQNAKLAEITTQLDNLLGDWLARKQRLRGTV